MNICFLDNTKARFSNALNLPKQQGTTLVIALVMLLVMTVIGVSNMHSSTMQERMAANNSQKSLSKYSAESALNIAENWLDANVTSIDDLLQFNGSSGLYRAVRIGGSVQTAPSTADIPNIGSAEHWASITAYTGNSNIIDSNLVSKQPQFIIEYIGRDHRADGNKSIGTDDLSRPSDSSRTKPFFFRISAIGWGKDSNIYTVLESNYKTGSAEFFNY